VPLLLVFENAPKSVELRKENGKLRFMVSFPSRTGRLALLPLFGHDVRKAADTEEWLREFPAEVKKQCDAWAEDLREFPVDVEETVTYDETGDRVTFTEAFEYVTLGSGGKKLAPLQGMLALGYSQGLPVKFSAEPMDMNVATQFGPTMVISGTGYSWSLEGLGKRVFGRQILGPPRPLRRRWRRNWLRKWTGSWRPVILRRGYTGVASLVTGISTIPRRTCTCFPNSFRRCPMTGRQAYAVT